MKGFLYIGMLIAVVFVIYLGIQQLTTPTPASAPLGKNATLQEIPALAKEKVDQAMELEAKQQKALEKQLEQ